MSLNFTKEACVNHVAYEGYQVKRKKENIMGGQTHSIKNSKILI